MRGLPKPFPVDPQVLAAYAGRYQDSDGVILTIRVDGTHIFGQHMNIPEIELVARSENQFYLLDEELTLYRNANGEVERILVEVPGETLEYKRVP
jgi:hypothetical protein